MATLKTEQLNRLSATETARRVAAGEITAEAVVRDCLARIDEREATVHAWAWLDPEHALSQARALDSGPIRGPLHGVAIGVKDIFDTADMPTEMGSPIYRGNRPSADAACVALARAAGAVILGKTVTCEFAGQAPGATTNPHNPAHTPGGSSSGSAAAVADFMACGAFGTQTGGSVLRPASYCGIVGYKPTYGAFSRAGIKFAAESLDTIGLHVRTVADAALIGAALTRRPPPDLAAIDSSPAIGLCRTYLWDEAEPETRNAVEDAGVRLAAAGARVRDIDLPDGFAAMSGAREAINNYERAQVMAYEWANHRDLIGELLRGSIEKGLEMPTRDYRAALELLRDCRARLDKVFDGIDVILSPSAHGEAPVGLGRTGNHAFQSIWTMLHTPSITLPTHTGPTGLPVGIQLIAPHREDDRLLGVARWVMDRLGAG